MPEQSNGPISLADAGQRYLTTLKSEARENQTPEIRRFVGELGDTADVGRVRSLDVERYIERHSKASNAVQRFESVRQFLTYLRKSGIIDVNLAQSVRYRKPASASGSSSSGADLAPEKIEMTAEGRAMLEHELEEKIGERPKIAEALKLAMADKDFRENAPLDAARDQQAHLEARIRELQALLKRAIVVDRPTGSTTARMGAKVHLRDLSSDKVTEFILVGPGEVNAAERKISVSSPVGKACVDHAAGEEVEVVAPSGTRRYRIEQIEV